MLITVSSYVLGMLPYVKVEYRGSRADMIHFLSTRRPILSGSRPNFEMWIWVLILISSRGCGTLL
jgi:hypothetical protein